jgi:hypothetical protein
LVADTLKGSSGSPVCTDEWYVVAPHRGGVPKVEVQADGQVVMLPRVKTPARHGAAKCPIAYETNEGTRVSRLYTSLRDSSRQERLDAHHLIRAAQRAIAQRDACESLILIEVVGGLVWWWRRWCREQLARLLQLDITVAVRQQPAVADALEARRQDMQQEAARELGCVQAHHLGLRLRAVVLPLEGDLTVGEFDKPVVGNRDAMRVAPGIFENGATAEL